MNQKPERGAPCNGCGWCCQQEVCGMALEIDGGLEAPCPFLRSHDGRFWCGVIEQAANVDVAFAGHLAWRLGIGVGCYAGDD